MHVDVTSNQGKIFVLGQNLLILANDGIRFVITSQKEQIVCQVNRRFRIAR